jgi:ABC-type bacteriocin/lantibiotic exporter with double-glycine peptidase domain
MKLINRRYQSDCYPTCVAIILGISHSKAIKLVFPKRNKRESYASDLDVKIKVFKRFGFKIKEHKPKKLIDIKHNAVLEISNGPNGYTHAVVWDAENKKVLDPGFRNRTRRFYQKRLLRAFELIG